MSLIDLDDSVPETTSGGNDLSGLFSYAAQPVQANVTVHAQVPAPYQQQQQQAPSPYAPTPLMYNSMIPQRQLSGTPPASIALPTSHRSTPVLPGGRGGGMNVNVDPFADLAKLF